MFRGVEERDGELIPVEFYNQTMLAQPTPQKKKETTNKKNK